MPSAGPARPSVCGILGSKLTPRGRSRCRCQCWRAQWTCTSAGCCGRRLPRGSFASSVPAPCLAVVRSSRPSRSSAQGRLLRPARVPRLAHLSACTSTCRMPSTGDMWSRVVGRQVVMEPSCTSRWERTRAETRGACSSSRSSWTSTGSTSETPSSAATCSRKAGRRARMEWSFSSMPARIRARMPCACSLCGRLTPTASSTSKMRSSGGTSTHAAARRTTTRWRSSSGAARTAVRIARACSSWRSTRCHMLPSDSSRWACRSPHSI
mmetsp:Transcript_85935/g.277529  ORF Transcript_85935/g.277529 Transcript_85935/m.277529 type:complete len:267 (-) Transcript_85935:520-1320(-)